MQQQVAQGTHWGSSHELEVRWAEKAGVKRVVTDQDAQIYIDGKDDYLPYHVCLSEFIFGAPLYKQRQALWGLPDPSKKAAATSGDGRGESRVHARPPAPERHVASPRG